MSTVCSRRTLMRGGIHTLDLAFVLKRYVINAARVVEMRSDGRIIQVVKQEVSAIVRHEWLHRVAVVAADSYSLRVMENPCIAAVRDRHVRAARQRDDDGQPNAANSRLIHMCRRIAAASEWSICGRKRTPTSAMRLLEPGRAMIGRKVADS